MATRVLVIACGALAHEIMSLKRANGWDHLTVQCLPAELHNRPGEIPETVRAKLDGARGRFESIFVAYADCGTGGLLDRVLADYGVERIPGAHCYQFFGESVFDCLQDEEPGSFYLTDFLVRHFERVVWRGLGMDRHPELRELYFGNYRRLVYLSQMDSAERVAQARAIAERLGLAFIHRHTGYGGLQTALRKVAA
jgi:hypothetical protein